MRISCLPPTRHASNSDRLCLSFVLLCCLIPIFRGARPAQAQVLARKNWAGSGVTVEVWWQRAVFYRVDPTRFQASKGDDRGDLEGLDRRLEYVQSLGVDALIVEMGPATQVGAAFDKLVRDAMERHLRVLVELGAPSSQRADAEYLATARAWLNQGAAGIYVPTRALQKVDGAEHIALLLEQLRELTDGFPGGRVLLADAPAEPDGEANGDPNGVLGIALDRYTQLTASAPLGAVGNGGALPTVAELRAEWMADLGAASEDPVDPASAQAVGTAQASTAQTKRVTRTVMRHGRRVTVTEAVRTRRGWTRGRAQAVSNPLLTAVRVPAMKDRAKRLAMERALAMMLLASRSAVLLDYGQELGLESAGAEAPLMQWTPTNLTRKPPLPPAKKLPPPPSSQYKAFLPWVKPLPRDLFPPPAMPEVEESDQPTPVNPALLPGFTAGDLDASLAAPNGATANVALETYQDGSLLNLYKQLIALHQDNATLRSGAQQMLNWDDLNALVWVRRAPPQSRTSATVVAACNLSNRPLVLGRDLGAITVNFMRSLLEPAPGDLLKLAPGEVMLGETQ